VLFARAKPEDQSCKHVKLFVVHGTVGAADGVEFSATFRLSAVADGGGGGADSEGFGEEDTTLMKEEVLVGDMIAVVANYPCFDGVGCCAPIVSGGGKHIEAARMREAQFLLLDFSGGSLVGRRRSSNICSEGEKGGTFLSGVSRRRGGGIIRHDDGVG